MLGTNTLYTHNLCTSKRECEIPSLRINIHDIIFRYINLHSSQSQEVTNPCKVEYKGSKDEDGQ